MTTPAADALSGPELRDMFAAAMTWLERHAEHVNAVNVFPVPDGDTGTNMFLTMRSTMQEAERCGDETAGAILAAMARGALMGARGNSGVILSQIIRGVAQAGEGMAEMDAAAFVAGLEEGAAAAYRAVTKPVEGTILTVVREVAEEARRRLDGRTVEIVPLLESAVEAAHESVARTPTLLPVLAEAGVVDAGALGLSYLLEGMLRRLKSESLEVDEGEAGAVGQEWLEMTEQRHAVEESLYGYCTEVLISGSGLDADAIRDRMLQMGDSVLVVGDEKLVRVHVHTDDPGAALSHGTSVGSLVQVKVDNIRKQAEQFVQMHEDRIAAPVAPGAVCTVAVVAGEGMAQVFESVGCTHTVSGGPTMNPSTRDILDAVEACPSDDVVVLPNDKNIIMAAQQAVGLTKKHLTVVPTRSMPQGIAALLAMSPEEGLEENAQAMEEGRQLVRTVEVTRAVRTTSIGGVKVEEGQYIAIVDDELKLSAASPEQAALQALEALAGGGTSLVTLYYGADTDEVHAKALAEHLCERLAGYEVEVVYGGQPHYDYVISVE
jgi:hypothetical protein